MEALAPEVPVTMYWSELKALVRQAVQAKQAGAADDGAAAEGDAHALADADADADADTEAMLAELHKYLSHHVRSSQGLGAVKGIPLPQVDEELAPLQQQVDAAALVVAQHRATVPGVIAKTLEQQMQQRRPAPAAEPGEDAAPPADQAGGEELEQFAAQVQQLLGAIKQLDQSAPRLRAQLEESSTRVERNIEAAEAAAALKSRPPGTVERVVRSVAAAAAGPGEDQ